MRQLVGDICAADDEAAYMNRETRQHFTIQRLKVLTNSHEYNNR
jgi:hypothetical protein